MLDADIRTCPKCKAHLFLDQVMCTDCAEPEDHDD